jgi:cell division initiation protein
MIDLTPLEVRHKKGDFRRVVRGYDPELVNDFLDLVADRLEELVRENLALRDAADSIQEELVSYRQKEQALSAALMGAQQMQEGTREQAERERELLLREARLAADSVRHEAMRQVIREEEALRQMKARRHQLVASFRRMLERELTELDVIQETLELGAAAPGDPPQQLGLMPTTTEPVPAESAEVAAPAAAAGASGETAGPAPGEAPGEGEGEASGAGHAEVPAEAPADAPAETRVEAGDAEFAAGPEPGATEEPLVIDLSDEALAAHEQAAGGGERAERGQAAEGEAGGEKQDEDWLSSLMKE